MLVPLLVNDNEGDLQKRTRTRGRGEGSSVSACWGRGQHLTPKSKLEPDSNISIFNILHYLQNVERLLLP